MRHKISIIFIVILVINNFTIFSQTSAQIYGTVSDTAGYPISFATISVQGTNIGVTADNYGQYKLDIATEGNVEVVYSCIGFKTKKINLTISAGEKIKQDIHLDVVYETLDEVKISGRSEQSGTIQRIDTKKLSNLPNASGNIENMVKAMPGVSSNNELSSQYSVRGGNFDENLVYVNDVEIYRPTLIRSGQQEGLSFVNPDLVQSLKFSAGGFDATYGDKMSSVLDITYKRPTSNAGSASGSLLGGTAHFEGVTKNQKFRHLTGIRYKTSQYLLSGMDTKGEYKPAFFDFQTLLSYDLSSQLEISLFGNISQNKYNFKPQDRTTEWGTFNNQLQLKVYFEGQEQDIYESGTGALTLNYHPNQDLSLKLIASGYATNETENYDILGQYWLNELDRSGGRGNDSAYNLAVGSFLNHARNQFHAEVTTISHIGNFNIGSNKIKWGLSMQHEYIKDKLSEWDATDSAGYTIFEKSGVRATNSLSSDRILGYVQNTLELHPGNDKVYITAGIRLNYWTLNKETVFNPRFQVSYKPNWKHDLLFYTSVGFYNQPAFFKEMRDPFGSVNTSLKAQKAITYLLGTDYIFSAWAKPFKFTAELYYKDMDDLVPYQIDNVKSIYAGENKAKGYAMGLDMKLNFELIKGTESWFSFSLLSAREDIKNDYYPEDSANMYPGYYPRPTDQLYNINLYMQDYLPRNPSIRVYINMHYGSSMPLSVPQSKRYDKVYRLLPAYKRVDLGFSKILKSEETVGGWKMLKPFKEVLFSIEVLNVLDINNTASFQWLRTVSYSETIPGYMAVPNYLTSRRFNLKLSVKF